MATLRKRVGESGTSYQVRWRDRDLNKEVSETFATEKAAIKFRGAVDAGGQRYPEGYIPRVGYLRPEAPQAPTLAEYFERSVTARHKASARSKFDYRRDFRLHVPEWLAKKEITEITKEDVGRWLAYMTDEQGLAAKTVHNIHGTVSTAMKLAQEDGLVTRNPFRGQTKTVEVKHEDMCFLTPEEVKTYLTFVGKHYRPFLKFLYGTGLRWSEATAMVVGQVDLAHQRIFVTEAWKRQPDYTLERDEPKTRNARRTVTLSPGLCKLLEKQIAGKAPGDLVFVNTQGNLITNSAFFHGTWEPAREKAAKAGFHKVPRVHDLRHSHAALLISKGIPMLAISKRLGHASISTTNDRYGHLLPEVDTGLLKALKKAGL